MKVYDNLNYTSQLLYKNIPKLIFYIWSIIAELLSSIFANFKKLEFASFRLSNRFSTRFRFFLRLLPLWRGGGKMKGSQKFLPLTPRGGNNLCKSKNSGNNLTFLPLVKQSLTALLFLGGFFFFQHPIAAQKDSLKIGIQLNPPFIIKNDHRHYEGLSIELWENIAETANIHFEYIEYADQIGILKALEYQEIDLTVNPMYVNAQRVAKFDMTQPYFISSIGVAVPALNRSPIAVFVSNIFSFGFLQIILLLIFVIFIFGFLLWLAERRHNKFQFRPGMLGLFDGLWWSAVTMTTVGYGDKSPKSHLGKVIAIIWMFTAVIIISSFTAGIASTLTIGSLQTEVQNPEDLRLVNKIIAIGSSNAEEYLLQEGFDINNLFASPIQALRGLARKDYDALLHDRTILQYYIKNINLEEKVNLLPIHLKNQYQSFMLPKNHPAFTSINASLVREIQKDSWENLQRKYNVLGN